MADLTIYTHDSFLEHEPPAGEFEAEWTGRLAAKEPHPDRRERIDNIRHIVRHELESVADVRWETARDVTDDELHRVHDPAYVTDFQEFCAAGGGRLTHETGCNEASYTAARHAAGAAIQAVDASDDAGTPYALVRPSGHHAQPAQADGFCFFNNVAVAAEYALTEGLAERVAVVDWDVHHGNGTQECFYDRDDVLFISLHNDHVSWDAEAHPQSGDVDEYGVGAGEGYNLNVPLPPGTGDEGYAYAFDRLVEPTLDAYDPDLVVVSAGQDPGTMDPLGRMVVTKPGFESFGRRARAWGDDYADGRLAVVQEGGYQISHLGYATLGVLEGITATETGVGDPFAYLNEDVESARHTVDEIAATFAADWPTG